MIDSRLTQINADMMGALASGNVAKYLSLTQKAQSLAAAHVAQVEDSGEVEFTAPADLVELPEWMGLDGIGFARNEPVVIGGFPGQGKTAFSANLTAHLLLHRNRVTIMTNETKDERYAANVYRILESRRFGRSMYVKEAYGEKPEMVSWYRNSDLKILRVKRDSPKQLVARMARIMSAKKTDVILFDWFQNIQISDDSLWARELNWLANQLQDLCEQWEIPIVVFSQVNREGGREKNPFEAPGLGCQEGSQRIEQVAGLVVNLKKGNDDDFRPTFLWMRVAKNRNGPTGNRNTRLDTVSGTFLGRLDEYEMDKFMEYIQKKKKKGGGK